MRQLITALLALAALLIVGSTGHAAAVLAFDNNQDLGTVGGSYASDGLGGHTIVSAGADIWGTADEGHFAYNEMTDQNIIITAQLLDLTAGVNGWSKMGVMIRDTLDADSIHGYMVYTPPAPANTNHRWSAQWREVAAGGSGSYNGPSTWADPYPHWVRMHRNGNQVTHYYSEDSTDGVDGTWIAPGMWRSSNSCCSRTSTRAKPVPLLLCADTSSSLASEGWTSAISCLICSISSAPDGTVNSPQT